MSKAQISNVIDSGKGKIGGLIVLALALLLTPILIITVAGVAVIGAAGVGGMQSAQMENNEEMGGNADGNCPTTVSGQTGSSSAGTSTDQDINNNVRTIIGVGKGLGISDVGIKIALVTAQKESSLRNLANDGVHGSEDDGGEWPAEGADHYLNIAKKSMDKPNGGKGSDHDSVGIFQQRVAYWWPGSYDDTDKLITTMMDPQYQATAFFIGIHGDGGLKGKTDVWNAHGSLSGSEVNSAVQAVQGAAAGTVDKAQEFWGQAEAYYNANADAPTIDMTPELTSLIGSSGNGAGGGGGSGSGSGSSQQSNCGKSGGHSVGNATGIAKKILENAYAQDHLPYQWGGGDANGPTTGTNKWPGVSGFDCSGLVLYSVYHATDGQVSLPHFSGAQEDYYKSQGWVYTSGGGTEVPPQAQPGDIVFFGSEHVAIYAGEVDGAPKYFQASWNNGPAEQEKDIGFGAVGRAWTSWGRTGGLTG